MTLYGKEHVERYQATGGDEGYHWRNGTTILLLHTRGRKSGTEYIHPLIYREFGDDYLIVASKGGSPEPPEWFRNLEAAPETTIPPKNDSACRLDILIRHTSHNRHRRHAIRQAVPGPSRPVEWRLETRVVGSQAITRVSSRHST